MVNKNVYFNYLKDKIKGEYYDEFLMKLHSIPFDVDKDNIDYSRAFDGLKVRREFVNITNGKFEVPDGPCTFLEMMIALSIRMDNDIMYNEKFGDRTVDWFWIMVENMGFSNATNSNWDESIDKKVTKRCRDILKRRYKENGKGGLFVVNSRPEDMREEDIWHQMMWFLSENIENGRIL